MLFLSHTQLIYSHCLPDGSHTQSDNAMPSVKELFNIIEYLEVSASEFFAPLEQIDTPYANLCERLRWMSDDDISKVNTLIDWIQSQ